MVRESDCSRENFVFVGSTPAIVTFFVFFTKFSTIKNQTNTKLLQLKLEYKNCYYNLTIYRFLFKSVVQLEMLLFNFVKVTFNNYIFMKF